MRNCEMAESEEITFKTFTICDYQIEDFYRYLRRLSFHLQCHLSFLPQFLQCSHSVSNFN